MILADKIIRLRKKNGWTQEELAERLNVSRQAVSKWEGAQTIPDLEKIIQLGDLFGVTTDYLLKDNIENEEFANNILNSRVNRISYERIKETIVLAYWLLVTVIYFICSFTTNAWKISWLIFVVGGILFTILMTICNLFTDK